MIGYFLYWTLEFSKMNETSKQHFCKYEISSKLHAIFPSELKCCLWIIAWQLFCPSELMASSNERRFGVLEESASESRVCIKGVSSYTFSLHKYHCTSTCSICADKLPKKAPTCWWRTDYSVVTSALCISRNTRNNAH